MNRIALSLVNALRGILSPSVRRSDANGVTQSRFVVKAIAALSFVILSTLPAAAQTYDATADYSTTNNPNGVWSSGYKNSLTGTLNLYDVSNPNVYPGTHFWQSSIVNNLLQPAFWKSFSSNISGQIPGFVHLHGGPNGEFSVLRFTAPTAGDYTIAAEWFAGDAGETSAHIVQNNTTTLFADSATSDGAIFNGNVTLAQGGFLEVGVGTAGVFNGDITPFALTIKASGTVAAPEPSVLALLGLVGAPFLVGVARRRK